MNGLKSIMKKRQLNNSQRDFFTTVYEAAFTNPFSEKRTKLDVSIAGLDRSIDPDAILSAAVSEVNVFIEKLDTPEKAVLNDFSVDDSRLIKYALFFSLFHGCME